MGEFHDNLISTNDLFGAWFLGSRNPSGSDFSEILPRLDFPGLPCFPGLLYFFGFSGIDDL